MPNFLEEKPLRCKTNEMQVGNFIVCDDRCIACVFDSAVVRRISAIMRMLPLKFRRSNLRQSQEKLIHLMHIIDSDAC